jgi:hypothetical protein
MVERSQVRCPVCRSVVPAMLLWAVGDACPRCHQALHVRGQDGPVSRPQDGASGASAVTVVHRRGTDGSRQRDSGARLERRADLVR